MSTAHENFLNLIGRQVFILVVHCAKKWVRYDSCWADASLRIDGEAGIKDWLDFVSSVCVISEEFIAPLTVPYALIHLTVLLFILIAKECWHSRDHIEYNAA